MNQVDGVSDMVSLLCGSVWGGLRKWTLATAWTLEFIWEEAVPWHSPWCQILQFLSICHCCLSSCCPGAGAPRECIWVSPKSIADLLRGDTWEHCSSFHHPNPYWLLQPEVMGAYIPGTGTLGSVVCCGAVCPCFWGIHLDFYLPHVCVKLPVPYLHPATCLDECDFFNSLIVRIPYSLIFDNLGQHCFVI